MLLEGVIPQIHRAAIIVNLLGRKKKASRLLRT